MAPIEPDLSNSNLQPLLLGGAYATLTTSIIGLVGYRVLYRSYQALSPAQNTRERESSRDKHVLVFQSLIALSASFALYYGWQLFSISYQLWALERGETIPAEIYSDDGIFGTEGALQLKLGRWLKDTDIISAIWEAALEKSRYQWWTQQLFLGASAWSLYVAIEGRRRNIPHLWAFIALSMLVSLSFAQNLFFLAILLTPTPLSNADKHSNLVASPAKSRAKHSRKASHASQAAAATAEHTATWLPHSVNALVDRYFPAKPADWTPHMLVYIVPLLMSAIDTVLVALAANTTSFQTFLSHLTFDMFLPLVLVRLAPLSWGTRSTSGSPSRTRALTAFSVAGVLSLLIYLLQSSIAIMDNDTSRSRRFPLLPFQQRDDRSRLDRLGSSITRILGSIADHPACGRIAWDVILSGASVVVWAGLRGVEAGKMLRAAGWATKGELKLAADVKDYVVKEVEQLVNHVDEDELEPPPSPVSNRGSKSSRSKAGSVAKKADHGSSAATTSGTDAFGGGGDAASVWRGDEEKAEDWEASALGWGMLVLGGLGVGSAAVFGAEIA